MGNADRGFGLFNTDAKADVVTVIWIVVFILWGWATLHNFVVLDTYELADLPTGLATVLVAIPLSKAVVEGAKQFRKS